MGRRTSTLVGARHPPFWPDSRFRMENVLVWECIALSKHSSMCLQSIFSQPWSSRPAEVWRPCPLPIWLLLCQFSSTRCHPYYNLRVIVGCSMGTECPVPTTSDVHGRRAKSAFRSRSPTELGKARYWDSWNPEQDVKKNSYAGLLPWMGMRRHTLPSFMPMIMQPFCTLISTGLRQMDLQVRD